MTVTHDAESSHRTFLAPFARDKQYQSGRCVVAKVLASTDEDTFRGQDCGNEVPGVGALLLRSGGWVS